MIAPDFLLITNHDLAKRIFYHLSAQDLNNCALVNKYWHAAVQDARQHRTIKITGELVKQFSRSSGLDDYIEKEFKYAPNIVIYGWLPKNVVPEKTYDSLLKARLNARHLVLKGRGTWLTCKCPSEGSSCGEQIDTIEKDDITNLETIFITPTFKISACALLDLVSRSPRLKTLRFFGLLEKCDHSEVFNLKRSLSDLESLIWPMVNKRYIPTATTLVKRNENITTFCSTGEFTCHLLASDSLGNLKNLSLLLNEKWVDDDANDENLKKYLKRAHRYTSSIRYLGLAKQLEALEVRTFDIPFEDDSDGNPSDLKLKLGPLHEQYKLIFWEQVAKLPNLKLLSVHGAWELEEVCRELAKHDSKIEFLKIGLLPGSLQAAVSNSEDCPTLSMMDGVRNLKKLSKLRSIWLICLDKIGSIDEKTATALKDLVDLLWVIDMKVIFTDEIESLLNTVMRRGNQLGKTYKVNLHIQSKEIDKSFILVEHNLKFPMGTDLKQKLAQISELEISERYGKGSYEAFQIWGLQQIDNNRDKATYEKLKSSWTYYDEQFNPTSPWYNSA